MKTTNKNTRQYKTTLTKTANCRLAWVEKGEGDGGGTSRNGDSPNANTFHTNINICLCHMRATGESTNGVGPHHGSVTLMNIASGSERQKLKETEKERGLAIDRPWRCWPHF